MNKKIYLISFFAIMVVAKLSAQTKVVLDNCDAITGWNASGPISLDNVDFKAGTASVVSTNANPERFGKTFATPIDTKVSKDNGYLSFWFYVSDVSALNLGGGDDGQIEITSSGGADQQEYNWLTRDVFGNGKIQTGWNKIVLKLSTANSSNGGANLAAINYFRIYVFSNSNVVTKIDNIIFYKPAANVFDNCDALAGGWDGASSFKVDVNDYKEGEAAILNDGSTNELRFRKISNTPFNTGVTKANGYLAFWLYVSDVSKIQTAPDGGQIEISSNNTINDTEEFNWVVSDFIPQWQNGWNKVVLKISDANVSNGEANLSAINYLRIYFWSSGQIVTKIDNITFTTDPNVLPVKLNTYAAAIKNGQAQINWSTSSETNSSHFELLRSANASDYTLVKSVKSNGLASSYSVIDEKPLNGINYYKLLQYDNDGEVADLGVKTLNFSLVNDANVLVYPTYVTDGFNIKLNSYQGQSISVSLTDLSGRNVFKKDIVLTKGQDVVVLKNELPVLKGVYVLQVTGNTLKKSAKLVFK